MKLEGFFIGLSIFIMIVTLGSLIVANMQTEYPTVANPNSRFGTLINKTVELDQIQNEMKENLVGQQVSDDSALDNMIKGAYLSIRGTIKSVPIFGAIITAVAMELGIPTIFFMTLISIVIFLITMAIVYIVFRIYRV